MKKTKTFGVVMLPTEKAENCLYISSNKLNYHRGHLTQDYIKNILNGKSCHLYIISDDEIKEGDYVQWLTGGIYHFTKGGEISYLVKKGRISELKKVVATTDKFLGLPLIHDSFLPPYIKSYNDGKKITEVDLEMDLSYHEEELCDGGYVLKKRPDGSVIIHQSKTYSKQEIIALCKAAYCEGQYTEKNGDFGIDFEQWISENIK